LRRLAKAQIAPHFPSVETAGEMMSKHDPEQWEPVLQKISQSSNRSRPPVSKPENFKG